MSGSDENNKAELPDEPGILAVSGDEISEEDDWTPEVERCGDPVKDRIRLLLHLHPDLVEFRGSQLETILEDHDAANELLRQIEEAIGASGPGPNE